ncbi:AAA family ATPase [Streptomyces microflavus]|uniref:AAA family ATPase n=1 Tax=Streptomyces microflavus TaxID=1919 RepID=UPI003678BD33
MRHLARIEVLGLFNEFDHYIELSDEPYATILSGPNGSGKTQTLRLVQAAFDFDLTHLASAPYQTLVLTFQKGEILNVSRDATRKGEFVALTFKATYPDSRRDHVLRIPRDEVFGMPEESRWIPYNSKISISDSHLVVGEGRFDSYILNPEATQEMAVLSDLTSYLAKTPWLKGLLKTEIVMIDTKRLHTAPPGSQKRAQSRKGRSILKAHLDRIEEQVTRAREASLVISQERDQSFPMRILAEQPKPMRAASIARLQGMYDEVHALGEELHSNGLSALPELMEFPDRQLTPFERRILTQFVTDWRKKFGPLLPVSEKLRALRSILNDKLRHKAVEYDSADGLRFRSKRTGRVIPVDSLSAGEQHLVVLFVALLFSATPGSIVLIDEPEISMHAAWKHAFLDDISRVAKIQDLQVILATHSTAIIKGRWELVQEIGVE